MTDARLVHVVPHTHWDREWYYPFQRFRMTLVDLVDRLLDLMEGDPRYVFTLDGQLATVDDYLEIRPENESRIRALVESGQLAIGPWQILVDEFLISGESIVRNLELGLRRAGELGGAMRIGYLPDMFGHVAQMPQLLSRAGLEHAVVWRGVPHAIGHHAFRWSALDGSEIRAEYLVGGYGAAAHLFDEPDGVDTSLERLAATLEPFYEGDELLAMVGTDHQLPVPTLVDQIERLNGTSTEFELRLATLGAYLERADRNGALPSWHGELRSGARANLLMGVTSARIDLKAACARAERGLERYAEPFQALHAREWPGEFLELAWRRVIDNSAHDSICGCSIDVVSAQVLIRYAEAEQIASELVRRAAASVAEGVPLGATAVLNPSPEARADHVELDVSVPAEWESVALELPGGEIVAAQELFRREPLLAEGAIPGAQIGSWVARRTHGRELFGLWLNRVVVGEREVVLEVGDTPAPVESAQLDADLAAATAAAPDERWRISIVAAPRLRLVARVPAPALGWTSVRPVEDGADGAVEAAGRRLSNGLVDVEVEEDGSFRLGGASGFGRLVDGGDCGDSYNYAAPVEDVLVERPDSVSIELTGRGPVRGEITVTRTYRWPLGLAGLNRRGEEVVPVPVTMQLELREAEPFVRVRVSFDNPSADHRLRFHVPLPRPATSSFAEGQFGVVERGPVPEGGWGEVPLATYPARGFVAAGGVAVLLDHVTEYEVVDGRELALTVLRSTGLISRSANRFRDDPAGPELAIPAAQCRGPWSFGFALYPHEGSWAEADVAGWADRYQHPFVTAPGTGPADLPLTEEPGLRLEGEGVFLSSLRRRGDALEARVVCMSPEGAAAVLTGRFSGARDADLLGGSGDALRVDDGRLRLELGPWEIRTVQLTG